MSFSELVPFLGWFQSNGGNIDLNAIGFKHFPVAEGGRGAVALKNFEKGEILFTIPRALTLSAKTSSLSEIFGLKIWKERKLDKGWSGLILCMMWEASQGLHSRWGPYLATLPTTFDTPMFWDDSDLKELGGTSVVEKLGKSDAEEDYNNKVLPAIQSRPDLFPPDAVTVHYSLRQYHIMGSRILSRSFDVERPDIGDGEAEEEEETIGNNEANQSMDSAMDVDVQDPTHGAEDDSHPDDDDEDSEEEPNCVDVSMVPIADLLNARYGSENAKLFYDETTLKMMTTKRIKAGEQIWNTYGDLPNCELIRRYGHVDLLPLPGGRKGNPGDTVEIRADLVVSMFSQESVSVDVGVSNAQRIDWWLEEGGDDVFVLDTDYNVPEAIISLMRLLYLSAEEWEKARTKSKPPKPKLDSHALDLLILVLRKRLSQYSSTIEEDEDILKNETTLPKNKYHATVVRLGEKYILAATLDRLSTLRAADNGSSKKRKMTSTPNDPNSGKSSKKSKR
ncbi:hypothetical protein D9757_008220 [Collybiopsis confluens]|uniref:Ribosomal lysine N-methyltransferase 4 n=1 Tax=Collybiopsis confluens TaxID=2823264 RepID=A0A8H5M4A3_9AGAR|nr:hypothetical protein D9757_008220 [Collybiopsis confluens]